MNEKKYEIAKKQFLAGEIPTGTVLAKVLQDLPAEDVKRLRNKAAEGMLGLELEKMAMIRDFHASSAEMQEFIQNIKDLESATQGTLSSYKAESTFKGATSKTTITAKKGCYIATYTYGSYLHPNVILFQSFRTNYLESNKFGRLFSDYYNRYSPLIVFHFEKSILLKTISKLVLDCICKILRKSHLKLFC